MVYDGVVLQYAIVILDCFIVVYDGSLVPYAIVMLDCFIVVFSVSISVVFPYF